MNGAPCVNEISYYVCQCLDGFTGIECQIDIDECASEPCEHRSPCTDSLNNGALVPGVYNCGCIEGFTGHNCGIDVDECAAGPCQNGAACYESGGNNPSFCEEVGGPCAGGNVCNGVECNNNGDAQVECTVREHCVAEVQLGCDSVSGMVDCEGMCVPVGQCL